MARRRAPVKSLLIASAVLLVLILALTALKKVPYVAEYVFTRGIARGYIYAVGHLTSLLPFSLFEFLCGGAIVVVLVSLVRWIVLLAQKKFYKVGKGFARMVVAVLAVVLAYTATASFSYYRADIDGHIPSSDAKPKAEAVMDMVEYYIKDFNALAERMPRDEAGNVVSPYTFSELAKLMQQEFERLDDDYFSPYTPRAKKMISGDIVLSFNITGISFQPTGEANAINRAVAIDMPALMAHELAHSKGVMRENDAEFVSAYITLTSQNDYIRYSGYTNFYGYISQMLSLNRLSEQYSQSIRARVSSRISGDYKYRREFYDRYPDIVGKVGEFINNMYLKLSGIKEGTQSYNAGGNQVIIVTPGGQEEIIVHYSDLQKMIIRHYENL